MTTILAEIFNHHLWANLGMIDACATLEAVSEREPFPGFPAIRVSLQKSGERLVALAQSERDDRLVTGERGGQPFSFALSVFMMQAVDHGKEHRTHVASSLTQLGIEPPNLDGWAYARRV